MNGEFFHQLPNILARNGIYKLEGNVNFPAYVVAEKSEIVPLYLSYIRRRTMGNFPEHYLFPNYEGIWYHGSAHRINKWSYRANFMPIGSYTNFFGYSTASRMAKAKFPERFDKNVSSIMTLVLYISLFGMYELLKTTDKQGTVKRIFQPVIVIGHDRKYSAREAIRDDVGNYFMDKRIVNCYVASEFDTPGTWDAPLRNFYRKTLSDEIDKMGIKTVFIPAKEFRRKMEYIPDFSGINPFDDITDKAVRNVKIVGDYYT